MNSKHVAYYRVSTQKQGIEGLGIDAQKAAVLSNLGGRTSIVAEYVEVESGKRADRPELLKALAHCRATGATLVIGKLDRLSRSVLFLSTLMEAGVQFKACDMPEADKTQLQLMTVFAEHETRVISARTKAALQAAKAKGTLLGCRTSRIAAHSHEGNAFSSIVRGAKANRKAADILPLIADAKAKGAASLREIADALNMGGIETPRKGGQWSAVQVRRIMLRAA